MNRSFTIISLAIIIFISSYAYPQNIDNWVTRGYTSGKFIIDNESTPRGRKMIETYIRGIVEGASVYNVNIFRTLYPDHTIQDIANLIIKFYKENPGESQRPVVEVFMTGGKI